MEARLHHFFQSRFLMVNRRLLPMIHLFTDDSLQALASNKLDVNYHFQTYILHSLYKLSCTEIHALLATWMSYHTAQ